MNEFYYYTLLRKDEKYLIYMLKDLFLFTNCSYFKFLENSS